MSDYLDDDMTPEEVAEIRAAQRRIARRDLAERILLALLSRREGFLPHTDCKLAVEYADTLLAELNGDVERVA